MDKQIKLYSINLGQARYEDENNVNNEKNEIGRKLEELKKEKIAKIKEMLNIKTYNNTVDIELKKWKSKNKEYIEYRNKYNEKKREIHNLYKVNRGKTRTINNKAMNEYNEISFFESSTIRTYGIRENELTKYFIVINCAGCDNNLINDAIIQGLNLDGNKYIFFTAGAGQTRQNKFMMIREDLWQEEQQKKLMCGLTIKKINEKGGLNINKYLAYLSLNNSASDIWEDFDIDRCIVVDDFSTEVNGLVDYISKDIKKENVVSKGKITKREKIVSVKWNNERKNMNIPIDHFDGLGVMLPKIFKGNRQFRLNWFKGLLTSVDYIRFIKDNNLKGIVTDIWGKKHNVIEENVEIIFTKSQFKLWKFYDDWDDYKNNFKKYGQACIAMEDPEDKDMYINYQMLQQLTDIADEQIEYLTKDLKELIYKVHSNRESQLDFLGAILENKKRSNFQEALRLYPEMLKSKYVKKQISDTITKAKKDTCGGRIKIKDSKRAFIIGDVYAWMEWLFKGEENPKGLLYNNEVYCKLYKNSKELDVLRSPSLSFEHAVRDNAMAIEYNNEKDVKRKKLMKRYFTTNGIYTSIFDLISKILQFDVDGDEALILNTQWIINLVKSMIKKYDIVPIYYEMGKAGAKNINLNEIYKSVKFVYEKSNIGKVSNSLTRLWAMEDCWDKYKQMQIITAYNNFIIDSAKTLELPPLNEELKELMKNDSYPYFFQFAKPKKEKECNTALSNWVMDRICKSVENIIPTQYSKNGNKKKNISFDYSKGFGNFNCKYLMKNNIKKENIDYSIIEYYLSLEEETRIKIKHYATINKCKGEKNSQLTYSKNNYYKKARETFYEWCKINSIDYNFAIDNIVKYSFSINDLKMSFLWEVFGKIIINNINNNLKLSIDDKMVNMCECCGKRFKLKSVNSRQKYCDECATKIDKEKAKVRMKKIRK